MRDVWVKAKVMDRRKEVNRTRRIAGNRPGADAEAEAEAEAQAGDEEGEEEMCLVESEGATVGDGEGRVEVDGVGMRGVRSDGAAELVCLGDMLPAVSLRCNCESGWRCTLSTIESFRAER